MLDFHSEPDTDAEITIGLRVMPRDYSLPRSVRTAIEYVNANLSEDIRLEDIARAARLSTFHFARVFKKTTGIAPHRYLVGARVGKVKELLGAGELCLAAIADEAGFSDQSHMSRVFKRLTGMTPKAFRDARKLRTADRRFDSFELLRSKVQRLRGGVL
jgi:AraC-like DNA-binding protein